MPSHRRVPACTRLASPARTGRTTAAVLAAGASLALLAGCASASDTTAAGAGAAPAAVTSAASPSLPGLVTRVATAVAAATSVHLAGDLTSVSGLPVALGPVEADVALAAGRPRAAAVTAGKLALRYVGGTAWVTLPGAPATTPWTLVSPTSSNPVVAMVASRLAQLRTKLAGVDPTALLGAASGLREVGGTAATQYAFTVDGAQVAGALGVDPGSAAGADVGAVPVQLWLDGSDRPVRVTVTPTLDGSATPLTVTLSAWNAPVTVTAPDASQVQR